jgi:hypothetical protein
LIIPLPTLRPFIPSLTTTTSDMATQRAFLQFVVEKALAGESDDIKDYTVATQVFGRRENLDPATDPIVSIQANKLRRRLGHYYLVAGNQDPIRIDIPKGKRRKSLFYDKDIKIFLTQI